jgi:hypothetical protein
MRRRVEVAKNFLGLSMQAEQDIFLSENSDLLYLGHLAIVGFNRWSFIFIFSVGIVHV